MIKNSLLIFVILFGYALPLSALQINGLSCNYEKAPFCIDDLHPLLSWQINAEGQGRIQSACRILVATSMKELQIEHGLTWDSGKMITSQSQYITYAGAALKTGETYYWKVKAWDEHDRSSSWSAVSSWKMGLLEKTAWQGRWITASTWFVPPQFRPKGLQLGKTGGWADVDLGKPFTINKIKLYSSDTASFPHSFKILASNVFNFKKYTILTDNSSDNLVSEIPKVFQYNLKHQKFRFIRLQVLPARKNTTVRQMEVYSGAENVAMLKFTREYGTNWDHGHAVFLVDGMPSEKAGRVCPADACPSTTAPEFRKSIIVHKKISSATIYYAALGMLNVKINGSRITDEVLGPPFTDYTKRVMYVSYDVTRFFKTGKNVIGAVLGNGFFSTPELGFGQRQNGNGPPRFILQTLIIYNDGSREWVTSDNTWKWSQSEIVFNDLWAGYTEDRNQEKPGWDLPDYDDSKWQSVALAVKPTGRMVARTGPPNKINGILRPVRTDQNHAYFETASVGWPCLKVNGKAGQKITISGGGPGYKMSKLIFTLAKDGPTTLSPDFVIQPGPVDLLVEGLTEPLRPEDISIQYVNADLQVTGKFKSSNPFLEELYNVTMRTHRNYVNDFPADPNREKQGWTQDAQNMFSTAAYFTDTRELYERWWNDMADNQDENGYLGSVVPVVNRQVYDWNSPWWSGMIVFLPWAHYQYYGDQRILTRSYDAMRRYVDLLGKIADSGDGKGWDDYIYLTNNLDTAAAREKMIMWNGAGDWNNPFVKGQHAVPTPVTTMPAWYNFATIVSKTAKIIGKKQDAAKYGNIANDIKKRFNNRYLNTTTGLYGDSTNSETAQILPLAVGMVPEKTTELTYQRLLEAIHFRNDHIGTGFTSLNFLLETLASRRESVLANKIINQKDYPGWKTLIKGGVMLETWSGTGAQMPSCGGAAGAWLFQSVLGIQPDAQHPGFRHFFISPQPDKATGSIAASGSFRSIYGDIGVSWECKGDKFAADIVIPGNTSATLVLPCENVNSLISDGNIKRIKAADRTVRFEAGPGKYHFETDYKL